MEFLLAHSSERDGGPQVGHGEVAMYGAGFKRRAVRDGGEWGDE